MGCALIGSMFAGLIYKNTVKVLGLTIPFVLIGMLCRYLIEFGEVSNTVNFTTINILVYLLVTPALIIMVYAVLVHRRTIK